MLQYIVIQTNILIGSVSHQKTIGNGPQHHKAKLYFAYTDLSPEVQQAYKDLIPYFGGVEDLLQESEEFLFYPECHNIMDVARYRLEHNIEFSALSEKGKKYFNLEAYAHELEEKGRYALCNNGMFKL